MGENFFRLKFTGDGKGNGEGVLIKQGVGLEIAAVKKPEEKKPGKSLSELLHGAKMKKIEVQEGDKVLETSEKQKQHYFLLRDLIAEVRNKIDNLEENEDGEDRKSSMLALINSVRRDIKTADKHKIESVDDAEMEKFVKDEILEDIVNFGDYTDAIRADVFEICEKVFGGQKAAANIDAKMDGEIERMGKKMGFMGGKKEEIPAKQEQKEKEIALEVHEIFNSFFNKQNFKGRFLEKGFDKRVSLYMMIQGATFAKGPVDKIEAAYVESLAEGENQTGEELKRSILEFCKNRAVEFSKHSHEPEKMAAALEFVCEEYLTGKNIEKQEKGTDGKQEIPDGEFEQIDHELTDMINAYEGKIKMGISNKIYGERTGEIAARQRKRLFETINGYGGLLDRYEKGERSKSLFEEYKKHHADMVRLKDEIFKDTKDVKAEKAKAENVLREKGKVLFEEYKERIAHGKEWRLRDIEKDKKNVPPFAFDNFKIRGLSAQEIRELKEYFNAANEELAQALAVKNTPKQVAGLTPEKLKEHAETSIANAEHVLKEFADEITAASLDDQYSEESVQFFNKQREEGQKIWQKIQALKYELTQGEANDELVKQLGECEHAAGEAHENFFRSKEAYKKTVEPDFVNMPESGFGGVEKEEVVGTESEAVAEDHGDAPDKEPVAENLMLEDFESTPHEAEEPVDSHEAFANEKTERTSEEKRILDIFLKNATNVGNKLLEKFEKDGTFAANGDDALEKKLVRVRKEVENVVLEILVDKKWFTEEKAKELALEVAQMFKF